MSNTLSIIDLFYQEEKKRLADEATFSPLDISVSSADMALISTIAKRFSKDRSLLAREALSTALKDMFSALDPVERKMLARDADELASSITAEIAEEQGLSGLEVSGSNWVMQDKSCVKAERKAEKEKASQQQKAASQVLAAEAAKAQPPAEAVAAEEKQAETSLPETSANTAAATEDAAESTSNEAEASQTEASMGTSSIFA